jgi:hypothetical protein
MNIIKAVWYWIITSSKDPEKLSLTLKAGVPFILVFVGWTSYGGVINQQLADDTVRAVMLGYIAAMLLWSFGWGVFRLLFRDDWSMFSTYGNRGNVYMLDSGER